MKPHIYKDHGHWVVDNGILHHRASFADACHLAWSMYMRRNYRSPA